MYKINARRATISGNELLIFLPTRRETVDFRERMKAADGNADEQERLGLDFVAAHVSLADGSKLDLDDVPIADTMEMLRRLTNVSADSVSDFTPTP